MNILLISLHTTLAMKLIEKTIVQYDAMTQKAPTRLQGIHDHQYFVSYLMGTLALLCIFHAQSAPFLIKLLSFTHLSCTFTGIWLCDRNYKLIPNRFHMIGLIAMFLNLGTQQDTYHVHNLLLMITNLIFVIVLYFVGKLFEKTTSRPSMGLGDVKLLGWLAFNNLIRLDLIILLAALIFRVEIICKTTQKNTEKQAFAFAPALIMAYIIACFSTCL